MSRREMKEEIRNREGDPRIRSRMRELRREMRKRALSLRKVAKADVLVTNPTRLAVALQYEHGAMAAPQVVAKGAGRLAAAMRRIASRHGVPIVENRRVARALFREVPVDGAVPAAHFAAVARIVVWVLAMRRPAERPGAGRAGREEAGWAS
jgi:flagellar biosynthetic protein FlhB